jgi:hypothetical protein
MNLANALHQICQEASGLFENKNPPETQLSIAAHAGKRRLFA